MAKKPNYGRKVGSSSNQSIMLTFGLITFEKLRILLSACNGLNSISNFLQKMNLALKNFTFEKLRTLLSACNGLNSISAFLQKNEFGITKTPQRLIYQETTSMTTARYLMF